MLEGKKEILEIGCGDGFGLPIVAQSSKYVLGIDVDDRLIVDNRKRLKKICNIEFKKADICAEPLKRKFDGSFSIDVIEHLDPPLEKKFMANMCKSIKNDGICIIGTPNKTADKYASERSSILHIYLKDHKALRALLNEYFINVFLFSMNDEVVHTGYYPMAHYLFGVGVGVRQID
jgi:2-polyprenyl-3-methyl-5-hydroxy-6-metoxy-1,4-benzoquinol methylase